MALWNPLTGWTGADAAEAKAAASSAATAGAVGKAGPTGGLGFGENRFVEATPGQYGSVKGSVNPDPRYPVGSPEWLAYYAPEYLQEDGTPYRIGGAEVVYGGTGPGQPSVRGLRPTGIKSPWSGVDPGMDEATIRKWMDSRNYFRNGNQGIDPRVLVGMRMDNPFAGDWEDQTASNQYGSLVLGSGPSLWNPYGRNAKFEGTNVEGQPYSYADQYWGRVQQNPTGQLYVPGWQTTAKLIGHPSFSPSMNQAPYFAPGDPAMPWTNYPAGTVIEGWYGDLTPEQRARAEALRSRGTAMDRIAGRIPSRADGEQPTGSGKWRRLENGNWLHVATGKVYDNKGRLISEQNGR